MSTLSLKATYAMSLTPERRARFEQLGYEAVRADMATGGLTLIGGPPDNREAAREWLREQEAASRAEQDHRYYESLANSKKSNAIAAKAILISIVALLLSAIAAWKDIKDLIVAISASLK